MKYFFIILSFFHFLPLAFGKVVDSFDPNDSCQVEFLFAPYQLDREVLVDLKPWNEAIAAGETQDPIFAIPASMSIQMFDMVVSPREIYEFAAEAAESRDPNDKVVTLNKNTKLKYYAEYDTIVAFKNRSLQWVFRVNTEKGKHSNVYSYDKDPPSTLEFFLRLTGLKIGEVGNLQLKIFENLALEGVNNFQTAELLEEKFRKHRKEKDFNFHNKTDYLEAGVEMLQDKSDGYLTILRKIDTKYGLNWEIMKMDLFSTDIAVVRRDDFKKSYGMITYFNTQEFLIPHLLPRVFVSNQEYQKKINPQRQ